MACIKEVNRSASVAFAPEAPYIAAGTMAGSVDMSFSSSANLDIFKLDFQSDDRNLPLVGTVPSSEPFNRLAWGKTPSGSENFSLGLIAGGLVDGNIGIWNPLSLIGSKATENALVQQLSKHKGPVRGLDFNPLSLNLLASGAEEGELCIWDISKPTEPSHYPPLKASGSATQGEISFLSWNSKALNILASTSYNGTTAVWDLRKQKPVISFSDSIRRRCSVLQWNPDFTTQLIVASDEDSSPSLRIWDMRNTMSPLRELVGHTKGVVAMSLCPNDSSYLITCAKDNRTICWDIISAEIVAELPAGTNWNFDVHWYPKIPGVISASSFDGKIGIYNVEACGRYGVEEGDFIAASLRAPKWYKRKAGVSFGFGGKLVSFKSSDSSAGSSEVSVHNLVTEQTLASSSSEFEDAMRSRDRSLLRNLCDKISEESESQEERETWGFLKVMFEDDGTARTNLLTHLGFTLPVVEKDSLSQDASVEENGGMEQENHAGDNSKNTTIIFSPDNGEDFFNNLPSPKADTPVSNSANNNFAVESYSKEMPVEIDDGDDESATDPSFDDAVQRALVVGDYKSAVEQCIFADRFADALVIAHLGGTSLWESTRDQYLKMTSSPYLKVVSAMVNNDLMTLVNTRPLKSWRETLALLCTFAQREEWTILCDTLASRLMVVGNTLAATLCYICAGNIDKTVEIWSKNVTTEQKGKFYVDLLQDLMEKTIVLALATGQKHFSASLCKLVEKYTEILASQGLLTTAMEYLNLIGNEELSRELLILRDCISLATEPEKELQTSTDFENSQSNYGVVDPSQHYYLEPAPSQLQQRVPQNSYNENYQQQQLQPFNPSYSSTYPSPSPYQPAQQRNMFLQPQPQQIPQINFPAPPVTTQPTNKPFFPSNPPALKNVDQYTAPTLASQLYSENSNSNLPAGPPGPISSHVGPAPGPTGFLPSNNNINNNNNNNNNFVNKSSLQPPPPSSSQPPPVVAPAIAPAPPPTVQTVDTSNVPAQQRPVIMTLTRLFNETSEILGGLRANPTKKREIEDNSRKIGNLFAKLNSGDISKNAAEKLVQLCHALNNGDFTTALQIQLLLTSSDWDECNFWLSTLKRMIKTRQNAR